MKSFRITPNGQRLLRGIVQKINMQYEPGVLEKEILFLVTLVLSNGYIEEDQLNDLQNKLYLLEQQERKDEDVSGWEEDAHSEHSAVHKDEIFEESKIFQKRQKRIEKENERLFWQTFIYRQNEIGRCMRYLNRLKKEPGGITNKKGIESGRNI